MHAVEIDRLADVHQSLLTLGGCDGGEDAIGVVVQVDGGGGAGCDGRASIEEATNERDYGYDDHGDEDKLIFFGEVDSPDRGPDKIGDFVGGVKEVLQCGLLVKLVYQQSGDGHDRERRR